MIRSLYTASTGMFAQQINMDNIANNISNVNTTGFKKNRVAFEDLLYSRLPAPRSGPAETTLQLGSGVRVVATIRDFSDGGVLHTSQLLDVALNGDGFLAVSIDGRTAYTRSGSLQVSGNRLVTSSGHPVLDTRGREITIGNDISQVEIDENGNVTGFSVNSGTPRNLGQIGVARVPNQHSMRAIGGNLFVSDEPLDIGEPGRNERARLMPGFLEMSNVQVVEEMVNLITAQRAYEVGSKAIQASDEMLQQANNLRR